jgi:hypothetical protein
MADVRIVYAPLYSTEITSEPRETCEVFYVDYKNAE